jgi:hypothetical protein
MQRLAALLIAGTLLCAAVGCGKYGAPKRTPKAIEASEPAREDEQRVEATGLAR